MRAIAFRSYYLEISLEYLETRIAGTQDTHTGLCVPTVTCNNKIKEAKTVENNI